jgi:membrane protein implicated in regulation of membrane protease activity
MSGVRDHLALFAIVMTIGCAVLVLAGLGTWNPWFQIGAPMLLMVICTRLLAPIYFGWREPDEMPRRRARP